jgi:hypothetical protein
MTSPPRTPAELACPECGEHGNSRRDLSLGKTWRQCEKCKQEYFTDVEYGRIKVPAELAEEYAAGQIAEAERCCPACYEFCSRVFDQKGYGLRAYEAGHAAALASTEVEQLRTRIADLESRFEHELFLITGPLVECTKQLEAILEIGKRDMSNPKYDSYFDKANVQRWRGSSNG